MGGPSLKARNDLLGEELERLETPVALQDALAEEEEHLAERHVARGVLDHARDRVGIADEERRATSENPGRTDPTGKDPRAVASWWGMDAKRRGALGMQRFDST